MGYGARRFEAKPGVKYVSYFSRHVEEKLLRALRKYASETGVSLETAHNQALEAGIKALTDRFGRDRE